ncbi:hypothetical protein RJ640_005969 [Escallonia rubra]|uniref:Secreted protein n=1 Tax=Escallonia rubra TaxID=112253 RepID=A0AA88R5N3_9ASTE|nr:hypothetical protein RJ640_005969 [Escallonia rubra]
MTNLMARFIICSLAPLMLPPTSSTVTKSIGARRAGSKKCAAPPLSAAELASGGASGGGGGGAFTFKTKAYVSCVRLTEMIAASGNWVTATCLESAPLIRASLLDDEIGFTKNPLNSSMSSSPSSLSFASGMATNPPPLAVGDSSGSSSA